MPSCTVCALLSSGQIERILYIYLIEEVLQAVIISESLLFRQIAHYFQNGRSYHALPFSIYAVIFCDGYHLGDLEGIWTLLETISFFNKPLGCCKIINKAALPKRWVLQ